MACCDYTCVNCGYLEASNFKPDKCPVCNGIMVLTGWDESKCKEEDDEQ